MPANTISPNHYRGSPGAWRQRAARKGMDPNIFFPISDFVGGRGPKVDSEEVVYAKSICDVCVVRVQCLEFALSIRELDGVWGGTTGSNRKSILRRRGKTG